MGSALTDADLVKITGLIRHWCEGRKLALRAETYSSGKENGRQPDSVMHAGTGFYRIIWTIAKSEYGIIVDMDLKPRFYFSLILNAILFCGLFYCTFLIDSLLNDFNVAQMLKLIITSPLVIIFITFKNNRLYLWMAQIEASFWKAAGEKINLEQLTKTSGSISTRRFRFVTELFLVFFAVYICTGVFGLKGFIVSSLVCSLFMIIIAAEIIRKDNPYWNWRFWIMGNMARWTILMLATNALLFVFAVIDIVIPLQPYQSESTPSVKQIFRTAKMRDVKPATAVNLENDCINYFRKLAENEAKKSQKQSGNNAGQALTTEIDKYLRFNCTAFLVIIILIPVYFFSVRPFRSLLKTQRIWAAEATSKLKQPEPFVPYISRSWKRQTPAVLRMLIFLHGIIGGVINITAVILCVDGWSYLLVGRSLLIEKSANIWSWPFALSKIVFGENAGQIAGTLILVSISMPFLFLFVSFSGRLIHKLILITRVVGLREYNNKVPSETQDFINKVCSENKIRKPAIILTNRSNCVIELRGILFGLYPVIEISSNVIDILSTKELNSVLAHELGHLLHGLWKTEILKFLSSVLFFPNYYLTLCMNWAAMEIEADRFSLEATKDKTSLKNALLKTSAFQFSNITYASKINSKKHGRLHNYFKVKLNSMLISVKFFYGDRLLGYTHPNLSERLDAFQKNFIE